MSTKNWFCSDFVSPVSKYATNRNYLMCRAVSIRKERACVNDATAVEWLRVSIWDIDFLCEVNKTVYSSVPGFSFTVFFESLSVAFILNCDDIKLQAFDATENFGFYG